jgi:hypothetical protein
LPLELKPQDLLVLLKVAAHSHQRWTYAALGQALAMSASEAHASVKRAVVCGLAVAPARGEWSPVRPSLLEFLLHGVRYVWPATVGPVKRGVPTSFGAEPLASKLTAAPAMRLSGPTRLALPRVRRYRPCTARRHRRRWPTRHCTDCWPCSMACALVARASARWLLN